MGSSDGGYVRVIEDVRHDTDFANAGCLLVASFGITMVGAQDTLQTCVLHRDDILRDPGWLCRCGDGKNYGQMSLMGVDQAASFSALSPSTN